jgi:putative YhbY family RNA-binding protein
VNSKQISYLRGLAHNLNPVVMISNKGLSEAVLKEINLNLDAHELIKIKVAGDDRELRAQLLVDICAQTNAKNRCSSKIIFDVEAIFESLLQNIYFKTNYFLTTTTKPNKH